MSITRDTPWREIGPVDWDIWHKTITDAGGPSQLAAREAWIAANPHSALALAMLKQESSYGTDFDQNPASNMNPWNLKLPAGGGYVPYATWADGALGWRSRITDPNYKNGIYHNTRSIKDLIYVYAPPDDNNDTDGYIAAIVRLMNGWVSGSTPVTPPPDPQTPANFTGWLDLMFRGGTWRITQDWAARGGPDLYDYAKGHGLDGQQHPGVDVGVPYGTKMYAPAPARVVCAGTGVGSGAPGGGCGSYNDWGDGSTVKQGVGRIELYFPELNKSLIYGHSRTSAVKPGDIVQAGQFIGTSGGMLGPHEHMEVVHWGTSQGYTYEDPRILFQQLQSGVPVPPEGPTVALPIKQQMIPMTNRNRPGIKLNSDPQKWITIHDTGNPGIGANAQMHYRFLMNGGGSESVSFTFTVDDTEAIEMYPMDEVTHHAGDGCDSRVTDIGCYQSNPIETCINVDGNWTKTKQNLVDLCAAIIKGDDRLMFNGTKGHFSPQRIGQHNKWSGKNCPARIRAEGSWSDITGQIASEVAGQVPPPPPSTTPAPVPDILPGLSLEVARRLFGQVRGDKTGVTYRYTPGGAASTMWLEDGQASGEWPTLEEAWEEDRNHVYLVFEGGRVYYRKYDDVIRLGQKG